MIRAAPRLSSKNGRCTLSPHSHLHQAVMIACPHSSQFGSLSSPKLSQSVHREECTQCFDNQDSEDGIDVCLTCFNGGCLSSERHHARTHVVKSNHPFTLNVKRRPKPKAGKQDNEERPAKMAKLAIVEEREEDKYDHTTLLKCWACDPTNGRPLPELSNDAKPKELVHNVITSMSSGRQSEVQAWEEEIVACEHTLMVEQAPAGPVLESGTAHCQKCDLKENLWLCLTCGSLGCGRKQFGGVGGNGHGLNHYEETRHPVSVKLGTITPEGAADVYCYVCDDGKTDPELARHLHTFGINVATQTKTEKSVTELQIEHNLNYDFSMTDDSGKTLQPVYGPGLTGLTNLGNSCYMASVTQSIFSLPAFQLRYSPSAMQHWQTCQESLPAQCLECQMLKLSDGLLSGRYSKPAQGSSDDSSAAVSQIGLRPESFKTLIGKGHPEFATMRQQDAEEFLTHLITVLRQYAKKYNIPAETEATEVFKFGMEQRLQCGECKRVRYRVDSQDAISMPVPVRDKGKDAEGKIIYEDVVLNDALDAMTSDEALEYNCPSCSKNVAASKRIRFATFPQVLVLHAKKFQLVSWVPTKLEIPIILPNDDEIILDKYFGKGLQDGEQELPEEAAMDVEPTFNEAAMAQLSTMGFSEIRCKKALLATGNADPEAAMEWLFVHMEDPDIDDPLPSSSKGSTGGPEPSAEQVTMLSEMGFTPMQARKALRETSGNPERAIEWLFSHPDDTGEDDATRVSSPPRPKDTGGTTSLPARYRLKAFISHKGPSVHSGHYVAHIKTQNEGWVFFNDEKVVRADNESVKEMKKLAYLYIFEKI